MPPLPQPTSDGERYFRLAEEGPRNVVAPFSGRIFHPLLARLTSLLFRFSLNQGFLISSVAFLFIFIYALSVILPHSLTHSLTHIRLPFYRSDHTRFLLSRGDILRSNRVPFSINRL